MARRRPFDEEFDLHGYTLERAKQEIQFRFPRFLRQHGRCFVKIIVGQGKHSPGGTPVLLLQLPPWLESEGRRSLEVRDVQRGRDQASLEVQIGKKPAPENPEKYD